MTAHKIPLTKGMFAIVDECDLAWACQWNWRVGRNGNRRSFYAKRKNRHTTLAMHREIAVRMGLEIKGLEIDHIDGDCLNNRRANLRVATSSQNHANYLNNRPRKTSRFKRVCLEPRKRGPKWQAQVPTPKTSDDTWCGKQFVVGLFDCEVEAALFADIMTRHFHGAYASANFPEVLASLPALHQITDEQLMTALELARTNERRA